MTSFRAEWLLLSCFVAACSSTADEPTAPGVPGADGGPAVKDGASSSSAVEAGLTRDGASADAPLGDAGIDATVDGSPRDAGADVGALSDATADVTSDATSDAARDATADAPPIVDAGRPDVVVAGNPDLGVDPDLAPAPRACTGPTTGAAVLCVDDDNAGAELGTAARPYRRMQAAIAAAKTGDTVQVAGGSYVESVRIEGKTLTLVGGFVGGNAAAYSGGQGGTFTARDRRVYVSHVSRPASAPVNEGAVITLLDAGTSLVAGFRISGGRGNSDTFRFQGGGVFAASSPGIALSAPTIANNLIEANDVRVTGDPAAWRGGGIAADTANVKILGNVIQDNRAGRGAGIAVLSATSGVIKGNIVRRNKADSDHGGGLYLLSPSVVVSENLIAANEIGRTLGYGWGGGVYVAGLGSSAALSFNVITDNYAPSIGAGAFIDNGATATLDHELFYANQCTQTGGVALYVDSLDNSGANGSVVAVKSSTIVDHPCATASGGNAIYVEGEGSRVTMVDSIVWNSGTSDVFTTSGGTFAATYTLSSPTQAGVGNVTGDPRFANSAARDYHLKSTAGRFDPLSGGWVIDAETSPAINAANPASPFAAEPAPNGARADLGAYGNTTQASKSP